MKKLSARDPERHSSRSSPRLSHGAARKPSWQPIPTIFRRQLDRSRLPIEIECPADARESQMPPVLYHLDRAEQALIGHRTLRGVPIHIGSKTARSQKTQVS